MALKHPYKIADHVRIYRKAMVGGIHSGACADHASPRRVTDAEERQMTHEPKIPMASQSPYPLHPAPIDHHPAPETLQPEEAEETKGPLSAKSVAIGIGSAAIVAALLYARRR
jgi:hypothetical protein